MLFFCHNVYELCSSVLIFSALQIGTPICIPAREFIDIGKVASIEINHKQVEVATKGQKVAIKVTRKNV